MIKYLNKFRSDYNEKIIISFFILGFFGLIDGVLTLSFLDVFKLHDLPASGLWALLCMCFFGGFCLGKNSVLDRPDFESLPDIDLEFEGTRQESNRRLVLFSILIVFTIITLISAQSLTYRGVMESMPVTLLATGTFLLVVVMPWLSLFSENGKRMPLGDYVAKQTFLIQMPTGTNDAWELKDSAQTFQEALNLWRKYKTVGPRGVRIVRSAEYVYLDPEKFTY